MDICGVVFCNLLNDLLMDHADHIEKILIVCGLILFLAFMVIMMILNRER